MASSRLIILVTSPRVPPGLLSRAGWGAVGAGVLYAEDGPHVAALADAGVPVTVLPPASPGERATDLIERARSAGTAIWLARTGGETELGAALGATGDLAEVSLEVVYGSWDPPGAMLLEAVAVMDRLRSPGGCPWDAEQTHESLMPYLLEEAYEAYGALEDGDTASLADELGDVLLQVLFHARVAQESEQGFDIDDVAGGLVAKLERRHPHVFADGPARSAAEVDLAWDAIKAREREASGRRSVTDGVPLSQPALSLARKLQSRAEKLGLADALDDPNPGAEDASRIGAELFALVAQARALGVDPEAALRTTARGYRDRLRAAELGVDRGPARPAG